MSQIVGFRTLTNSKTGEKFQQLKVSDGAETVVSASGNVRIEDRSCFVNTPASVEVCERLVAEKSNLKGHVARITVPEYKIPGTDRTSTVRWTFVPEGSKISNPVATAQPQATAEPQATATEIQA